MSLDRTSAQKADELLKLIIQHQPGLFTSIVGNTPAESGEKTAAFVLSLRLKLIEMFTVNP